MTEQQDNQEMRTDETFRDRINEKATEYRERFGAFFERQKEKFSSFISSAATEVRERAGNTSFRQQREEMDSGENFKDILSEVRGKIIDKTPTSKYPVPASFAIGIAGGVLREQALEAGLEVAQAAPIAAAVGSLARDSVRALTNKDQVISTLAARYVKEKPGSRTSAPSAGEQEEQQGEQRRPGFKEKALGALAKVGWWAQIVERTAVKRITRKEFKEGSRSRDTLEFINGKLAEIKEEGGNVEEYLSDTKHLRSDLNAWLKEKKVTDRTGQLIETFGDLSDAKTLNSYRDMEFSGFTGGNQDETVVNFETFRNSLHDMLLINLTGVRNLNRDRFNGYVDQLANYRWSKTKKAAYAGAIMGVGAGMAAVKAFAGVKAVDAFRHLSESGTAQEIGQQANKTLRTVGETTGKGVKKVTEGSNAAAKQITGFFNKSGEHLGQATTAHHVPGGIPSGGHENVLNIPHHDVGRKAAENIFSRFTGDVDWNRGAEAGQHLADQINMGGLKESWMHGDIPVPRKDAFGNFFGHWIKDGGPLNEETGVKMAENLRDALLVDQDNFLGMAHMIRNVQGAASGAELTRILSSMSKENALNVVYYSYAEGLPFTKNPEIRQVLVDFMKNNT